MLGAAKQAGAFVTAVDPYADPRWGGGEGALEVFQGNLARHEMLGEVSLIRGLGAEAGRSWTGPRVGLLFVDGAHDYRTVLADLRAWTPHLSSGAVVAMHDAYSSPGVTRAAFRVMFGARGWRYEGSSGSLARFRRAAPSARGIFWSSAAMLGRLPWLARNLAIKLALRRRWNLVPRLLGHHDMSVLPY